VSTMNGDGEAGRSSWQRPDAPLGTLIFREGLLSAEQLEDALGESVKRGKRLGQVLVERGLLEEAQVARILARQKSLDYVDLGETAVDPATAALLSSDTAWHAHAVAIAVSDGTPVVAVEDPSDEEALTAVAQALGTQPRFVVATRSEILRVLGTVFPGTGQSAPSASPVAVAPAPVEQPAPTPQPVVAEVSGLRVAAPPQEPAPEPAPAVAEMVPEPAPVVEPAPVFESAPEPAQVAPAQPSPEPAPVVSVQPPPEVVPVAESPTDPAAVEPAHVAPPELVVEPVPALEQLAEATPATAEPQPEPAQPVEMPHVVEVVPEQQLVAAAPPPAEESPAVPAAAVVELAPQTPPAEPPQISEPAPPLEVVAPAPEPVAPPVAPLVEAAPSVPEPAVAPLPEEPVSFPVAEPEVEPGEHRVVARLSDGGEIEVGVFASHEEAGGAAKLLSRQIGTAAPGEWPHLGGRFVRPDLIVSVDLTS
jgi:type IV pilus assembly protein PilB